MRPPAAKNSLSDELIAKVEAKKLRNHQRRLQRFGRGVVCIEYWDGEGRKVKAVPFAGPHVQVRTPIAPPDERHGSEDEELEELKAVENPLPDARGDLDFLPASETDNFSQK